MTIWKYPIFKLKYLNFNRIVINFEDGCLFYKGSFDSLFIIKRYKYHQEAHYKRISKRSR